MRDHVLLAAVERLGERERGLRLADAAGAREHEHADGLVGVVEARAGSLDALGDGIERVALADDAFLQRVGKVEDGLDFVLDHLPTGMPVQSATTEATACSSTAGQDERFLALDRFEFGFGGAEFAQSGSGAVRGSAQAPATPSVSVRRRAFGAVQSSRRGQARRFFPRRLSLPLNGRPRCPRARSRRP